MAHKYEISYTKVLYKKSSGPHVVSSIIMTLLKKTDSSISTTHSVASTAASISSKAKTALKSLTKTKKSNENIKTETSEDSVHPKQPRGRQTSINSATTFLSLKS